MFNADFSFNLGGDGSLKPWIDQINFHRGKLESKPTLHIQQANQGQQCYLPNIQGNPNPVRVERQVCDCAAAAQIASSVSKIKPLFLNINAPLLSHRDKYSPFLKTISRMHFVLNQYWDYLKQYGIDFNKFSKLTCEDLEYLGIRNREHLVNLHKAVEMAHTFY